MTRLGAGELPGGAVALMKLARKAQTSWFVWTDLGRIVKPVKVTAAKDTPDGAAVYEDRDFPRILVKGKAPGRGWVVQYLCTPGAWSAESAYIVEKGFGRRVSVAEAKAYIAQVPSTLSGTSGGGIA